MKTIIISTCLLVTSVLVTDASSHPFQDNTAADPPTDTKLKQQRQERGALKGPRAKNYPTWKYQPTPVAVKTMPTSTATKAFGPAAKNRHPWQNSKPPQRVLIKKKDKGKVMGPRAKNQKP